MVPFEVQGFLCTGYLYGEIDQGAVNEINTFINEQIANQPATGRPQPGSNTWAYEGTWSEYLIEVDWILEGGTQLTYQDTVPLLQGIVEHLSYPFGWFKHEFEITVTSGENAIFRISFKEDRNSADIDVGERNWFCVGKSWTRRVLNQQDFLEALSIMADRLGQHPRGGRVEPHWEDRVDHHSVSVRLDFSLADSGEHLPTFGVLFDLFWGVIADLRENRRWASMATYVGFDEDPEDEHSEFEDLGKLEVFSSWQIDGSKQPVQVL